MNAAASIRFRADVEQAAAESFYHLRGGDIRNLQCGGLACFVARHHSPADWSKAETQEPRLYCHGRCHAAPASGKSAATPRIECPTPEPIVLARILKGGAKTLDRYRELGGYQALEYALRHPGEHVIRAIESSQLRGRGGAAFPTGQKLRSAMAQRSDERYVIANGDEGDCGAYIDRILMEEDPFAVIEGLTLAAYATGARRGWIYVRAEYPDAALAMQRAVKEAYERSFLGENICNTSFQFTIEVICGKGSYLCGEETSLIRSIEGLRPEAQVRPPFCSERGLFGQPTVINNIETLINIPWIVLNTGGAFASFGFSKSRGSKVVSLNSLFRRPGLYEVEFGIRVGEIIEELGGGLRDGKLKGVIIGGPLAGVIPPDLLDTPFGFEELREIGAAVGHGGVIAFDERTSISELVHQVFSFGAYESCGKCAPCRVGSRRIEEIFRRIIADAKCSAENREEWQRIVRLLKTTSLCGHGTGLAEFAESIIRHYRKEMEACFA